MVFSSSIVSNNVTGQVLLHCEVGELKSVLNMNFGDWELFKLVVNGMRDDEMIGPSKDPQEKTEANEPPSQSSGSSEKSQWQSRKHSNIEKQVALEEAAVSGLLSTLNEDAKEDILLEELDNAREAASNISQTEKFQRQISNDPDESDILYYSHVNNQGSRLYSRDDVNNADMERGRLVSKEMVWSAASSRRGSMWDLDAIPSGSSPGSRKQDLSREDSSRKSLSRTNTSVSFLTPVPSGDADPFKWLSAPPSPRQDEQKRYKYYSDSNTFESDSNMKKGILLNRSVKRTKKKPNSREAVNDESDDNTSAGLSRTGSRVRLDKMKRKLKNVLTSNEPGQLPKVQRAKPNLEEYQEFNKSQKNSRSNSQSSMSGSVCLSEESLSSPEQQTIAKRPDVKDNSRPTVQNLFPATKEEDEVSIMTATLPDGSNVTASPPSSDKS